MALPTLDSSLANFSGSARFGVFIAGGYRGINDDVANAVSAMLQPELIGAKMGLGAGINVSGASLQNVVLAEGFSKSSNIGL